MLRLGVVPRASNLALQLELLGLERSHLGLEYFSLFLCGPGLLLQQLLGLCGTLGLLLILGVLLDRLLLSTPHMALQSVALRLELLHNGLVRLSLLLRLLGQPRLLRG